MPRIDCMFKINVLTYSVEFVLTGAYLIRDTPAHGKSICISAGLW